MNNTYRVSHPNARHAGSLGLFYPVMMTLTEDGLTPELAEHAFRYAYETQNGKITIERVPKSPDLLEACYMTIRAIDQALPYSMVDENSVPLVMLRQNVAAAIAKATGE